MRALICHDDGQLRRIEGAIAAIESAPPSQRQGKLALLEALRIEHASLSKLGHRSRAASVRAAEPAARKRMAWLKATSLPAFAANA